MSFSTSELVDHLRAARGQLVQQKEAIDRNIAAIDVLIGETGAVETGFKAASAPRPVAAPIGDDLGAKVLRALNGGPLAGSHIAGKVKADPGVVRACLKRLEAQRLVHCTGAGPATKWHLGAKARSATPAKEEVRR